MSSLEKALTINNESNKGLLHWRPTVLDLKKYIDRQTLTGLIQSKCIDMRYDTLLDQCKELIRARHPNREMSKEDLDKYVETEMAFQPQEAYGNWVYYSWSKRLVHCLPKRQYDELRLDRNKYKITKEERQTLQNKSIGIVGLSAGRACCMSLALEGIGETFRLADYDDIAMTNLNRVETGVHNVGVNKAIDAARAMYELNPYYKIEVYKDGINESNIESFVSEQVKLDIVIDECDDLYVKLKVREVARKHQIPVVMCTSEKGMIDIERYDLEPQREIFHGLLGDIDPNEVRDLSSEGKVPYVMKLIGEDNLSDRARASMLEIGETTTSFCQLASDVLLGGATVAHVTREIFLEREIPSGRYFVDVQNIVGERNISTGGRGLASMVRKGESHSQAWILPKNERRKGEIRMPFVRGKNATRDEIASLVEIGTMAPSGGNCQPWRFEYRKGKLLCIHDIERSKSFLDYDHNATYATFGCVAENFSLAEEKIGKKIHISPFPDCSRSDCICEVEIKGEKRIQGKRELYQQIADRATNRRLGERVPLTAENISMIKEAAITGNTGIIYCSESDVLEELGDIIGEADKIRLLNKTMHKEMMNEIRWSSEDAILTRDGLDIATLELTGTDEAGMKMISSYGTMSFLNKIGMGRALKKISKKAINASSGVALITAEGTTARSYFDGGRAVQRMWLTANAQGLSVQPMTAITYLFNRMLSGDGVGFSPKEKAALTELRERYLSVFGSLENKAEVMLLRIATAPPPSARSLRRPVEDVLRFC